MMMYLNNPRKGPSSKSITKTVFPHPVCPHVIAEYAVRGRRSLIGCLDEAAILDIELGVAYQVNVDVQRTGRLGLLLNLDGHLFAYSAAVTMEPSVVRRSSQRACLLVRKPPRLTSARARSFAAAETSE